MQYTDLDGYEIETFRDGSGFGIAVTSGNGTEVSAYLSPEAARELAAELLQAAGK